MPGGTTHFPGVAPDDYDDRRWLARASFALMLAAVALVLAVAGWHSLTLIAFAAIGVCAVLAGGYWFLANRGVRRWIALALVVAAPVLILVAFTRASRDRARRRQGSSCRAHRGPSAGWSADPVPFTACMSGLLTPPPG